MNLCDLKDEVVPMEKAKVVSPFRLATLLHREPDPRRALDLFHHPNPSSTKPFRHSRLAYDLIICKLGRAKMFPEMEIILHQMRTEVSRFSPKEPLFCSIISFYGRSGMPNAALHTYHDIPSYGCRRTAKSHNTLLAALLRCREFNLMFGIYENNLKEGDVVSDVCTFNVLIHACCLNGRLDSARGLFDEMWARGIRPNVVTFGTLVHGLCEKSMLDEAFLLKEDMVRVFGVEPNVFIYTSLIKGLCKMNELDKALELKEEIMGMGGLSMDSVLYSTIISALFRAGRKGDVAGILEEMKKVGSEPDTVTYNAMISGLCNESDLSSALGLLEEMDQKGVKADVVSYNIIVSGLCREGRLEEASDLFEDMPRRRCLPDVVSYRIFFDALSDGKDVKQAAFVLDEMLFKGFSPHLDSVKRFLTRLITLGSMELLASVLHSLGKENVLDMETWKIALSFICENSMSVRECELINSLAVL